MERVVVSVCLGGGRGREGQRREGGGGRGLEGGNKGKNKIEGTDRKKRKEVNRFCQSEEGEKRERLARGEGEARKKEREKEHSHTHTNTHTNTHTPTRTHTSHLEKSSGQPLTFLDHADKLNVLAPLVLCFVAYPSSRLHTRIMCVCVMLIAFITLKLV